MPWSGRRKAKCRPAACSRRLPEAQPGARPRPSPGKELDYRPADERLKAVLIDHSPDESFASIKADSTGRLFVGGREALFVYEPDGKGGYQPRRELYRFPPDSWLAGIEIRGDDLYVLTDAALYLLPGARTKREGLTPKRLIWGMPLNIHNSCHCLAWGPEGDLYLDHGDPLLDYGDFSRPDHFGHWTIHCQPEGTTVPYTGSGGVFRIHPDGSGFRQVAGGLRGCVGLCFDHSWNLFTNDNDHESKPDLYTPARLMHVSQGIDFAWPRGWIASKNPDRFDLVETMLPAPGRGVPVGMTYYDEPLFADGISQLSLSGALGPLHDSTQRSDAPRLDLHCRRCAVPRRPRHGPADRRRGRSRRPHFRRDFLHGRQRSVAALSQRSGNDYPGRRSGRSPVRAV